MNYRDEITIFRKVSSWYLIRTVLLLVVFIACFFAGVFICKLKVWYQWDELYWKLKWIEKNAVSIFFAFSFLVMLTFSFVIIRKFSKDIVRIVNIIDDIYNDKESDIILSPEYSEVMNRLSRLQVEYEARLISDREANQKKNDMIMYMAHDLKTPLTSVIGYLELLKDEALLPVETRDRFINIVYRKSVRLEELINEFFDITRYNLTHIILQKERVNLSVMLEQILVEFMPLFKEKNLVLTTNIDRDIYINGDVDKLERVFDNLIKNIISYSYSSTETTISLKGRHTADNKQGVIIETLNHGRTIPAELQEHIFEQFFRLDSSRASSSGGAGIGLAVAREIVELHGGSIICESENEEIHFILTL